MEENSYKSLKHLFKALLHTVVAIFVIYLIVYPLILKLYGNPLSAKISDDIFFICLFIGVIFTIFLCTEIILEEIKNIKKGK